MKKNHNNLKLGRIMIVDDEAELMTALCEAIAAQGYETTGFTTGADALKVLVEQDYDLLLTDLMMPEIDGIALLKAGLEIDPNLVCIIMTGQGTIQTAVEAMKKGAFDYVLKPFKLNTLMPVLSRAMEVRSLRMDNIQLKETVAIHELGKAIAFSTDLNAIMNKVADAVLQQCASDEVSIMIPTRDGKELYIAVARGGHTEYIGERVPMGRGIAGWVASNRETVIINGKVDDPRFSPVNPRSDIRAAVSMPMMAGGNLVGVLNVNVTKSHRHITLGQVKALSILVSIISPILENTWLNIRMRQAEEKYRSIFENSTEGIFQSTPEGRFIIANRAFAGMLSYDSPEELISAVTDIASQVYVNPEEREKLFQVIKDEGKAKSFETRFYRKDRRIIWVSISMHAVFDENGNLLYYEGIEKDITERKLAESQRILTSRILETLNRPNEIINLIRDILLLLKEHTGVEAVGLRLRESEDFPYYVANGFSDNFLEAENYLCSRDNTGEIIRDAQGNTYLSGRCGNVLCGRTDASLPFFTEYGSFWTNSTTKHPAEISREKEDQRCIRNRCNSEGYESIALIPLRSGDEITGLLQFNGSRQNLFTSDMIRFLEGIGASIGIAIARERSVEALRANEEKYRSHFENVSDVIFSYDREFRILSISPSLELVLGYKPEEFIGKPFTELNILSPEYLEKAFSDAIRVLAGEHLDIVIYEFIARDGTIKYGEISSTPLLSEGQVVAVVSVARDITDRKKAEEELRITQFSLDRTNECVAWIGPDGRFLYVNDAYCRLLNYSRDEMLSMNIFDVDPRYSADKWPEYWIKYQQKTFTFFEYSCRRKDGILIPVEVNANYLACDGKEFLVSFVRDISQRKLSEERLKRQLDRLAALRAIDMAITSSLDIRVTFSIFLEQVVACLGVDAADILLLNTQMYNRLAFVAGRGFRTSALRHTNLTLGAGYAGVVAQERKTIFIPDIEKEGQDLFKKSPQLGNEDFVTYCGTPLIAKGHVRGVLEIFNRKPFEPDQEWLDFMEALATQAAIAIDNVKLFDDLQKSNLDLLQAYDSTLEGWSKALDLRDKETEGHSLRVTDMTLRLAGKIGMRDSELVHMRRGALLHDIGKMGIPDGILLKPGALNNEEWEIMRKHPGYAYELLYPIYHLRPALDIPYSHHEKWDGTGYPRGLKGEHIPLAARIFSIVDVWDALCSERPYRPAWPEKKSLEYIMEQTGKHFDPKVVEAFLELLNEFKPE